MRRKQNAHHFLGCIGVLLRGWPKTVYATFGVYYFFLFIALVLLYPMLLTELPFPGIKLTYASIA